MEDNLKVVKQVHRMLRAMQELMRLQEASMEASEKDRDTKTYTRLMVADKFDLSPPGILLLGEVNIEPQQFDFAPDVVLVHEEFRKPLSLKMVPDGGSGVACLFERLP